MKYAIVGSRNYSDLDRVVRYVASLPEGSIVVSGDGGDVDKTAAQAARDRGWKPIIKPADWKKYGLPAGPMRNTQIVAEADVVIAFWNGISSGTMDTICKAVKAGKTVVIYGPRERGKQNVG